MSDKVGLVIISHSSKIGNGLLELINQVIKDVPIAVAAGTEEDQIGTSVDKIIQAIEQVNNGNGVLLMYDLGSARMNAEMAIEFSEETNIQIADHIPLVEGTYIAAVEANMGKNIKEIRQSIKKLELSGM